MVCPTHVAAALQPPRIMFLALVCGIVPVDADPSRGAEPTVSRIVPLGVLPGQTAELTVRGSNLKGVKLWTTAGMSGDAAPSEDNSSARFSLTAPPETPLGIHGLRVINADGVSPLHLLVVDDLPPVLEAQGNDTPESAQAVTPPCAIDGQLVGLTRDFYRFEAQRGQTMTFEVLARRLGSPLDPVLFLYREDGRELAYSDDAEGLSSDCQLHHTFDVDGVYVVEVRDIRYGGGDTHVYRLRIGNFPCINVATPMGVRRGVRTRIDFAGILTDDADPAWADVPADWPHEWFPVSTRRPGGAGSGFTTVSVSDLPEFLEREPNDTRPQANRIEPTGAINGRFDDAGDIDRFTFTAAQNQRFTFRGVTRQAGAPTDLTLRMLDATGKPLARVDDTGTNEGTLDFKVPANGEFTLEVSDLHRRGGSPYAYRIAVTERRSGFTLAAQADRLNVPAGGVAAVTVTANRQDYGGPITLAVEGLPEGLSSIPTSIGPRMNTAVLTIQAREDAPRPTWGPVTIVGTARIGDQDVRQTASISDALRGLFNNVTLVPRRVDQTIGAAVAPAGPLSLTIDPPTVTLGPGLSATVRVIARRGEGLDQQIQLATNPAKNALPKNVKLELKPIPAGQNELALTLSAAEGVPLGPYTVVLTGTHQKDKQTVAASTPSINYRLEPPLSLQIDAESKSLTRGGSVKVKVSVGRNPALGGDVKVQINKLPAGVTAEAVTIPADNNAVEITLSATAEALIGPISDAVVRASAGKDGRLKTEAKLSGLVVE